MHPAFSAGSLAETASGYYKAEVIRGPARSMPWKTVEDVELATLGWVHWHNTPAAARYLGDVPPTEYRSRSTLPTGPTSTWSRAMIRTCGWPSAG